MAPTELKEKPKKRTRDDEKGTSAKKLKKDFADKKPEKVFADESEGKKGRLVVKSMRKDRKTLVDQFERIAKQAKILTAKIQLKTNKIKDRESRKKLVDELFGLLKPKLNEFSMKHDTCRTIQCCFKFADDDEKTYILETFKDRIIDLCKGKYSCFMMLSFLKNGGDQHKIMLLQMFDKDDCMMKYHLGTHIHSSHVVDQAIKPEKTDSKEVRELRKKLFKSYFGERFKLMNPDFQEKVINSDLHFDLLQNNAKPIEFEKGEMDISNFEATIRYMKKKVMKMIDKGLARFYYVHKLCYFLFTMCELRYLSGAEVKEHISTIEELTEYFVEPLLLMFGSLFGVKAVVKLISYSPAKQKKKFIKQLQSQVMPLASNNDDDEKPVTSKNNSESLLLNAATHEFGYLVICSLINCTDDVVLLKKSIFKDLGAISPGDLYTFLFGESDSDKQMTEFFRIVSFCLVMPDEKAIGGSIHKEYLFYMKPKNDTAKKEPAKKYLELAQENPFLEAIGRVVNDKFDELVQMKLGSDLIAATIGGLCFSSCSELHESLASKLTGYISEKPEVIENPNIHFALKKAIHLESEKVRAAENPTSNSWINSLSFKLWDWMASDGQTLQKVLDSNRGSFTILALASNPNLKGVISSRLKSFSSSKVLTSAGFLALKKDLDIN